MENQVYSSMTNEKKLKELQEKYSFIELGTIGNSVLGNPLWVVKIGVGEKEVFYNGTFHANEWIVTPMLTRFIEDYGRAFQENEKIYGVSARFLYENYTLYIIPLVNPDGMDLVTGALKQGEAYERAREIGNQFPDIPFPDGWKANIQGVDLNLQFPAGWEIARAIKFKQGYTKPAPRDYVGSRPLCAQESRLIYTFTRQHNFSLILAYHTQGEVIYWKYLDFKPKGAEKIGKYFQYVSGYQLETTPAQSGYAGYKDWFILEYNRPGYTIEAGLGNNPLPIDQLEEIYQKNLGILVGGMTEI